jgi:hypothetical protein
MKDFPAIKVLRKTGNEPFVGYGGGKSPTLRDFWQWSTSDLVSNATRGILAEYLVACALGLNDGVRKEWDAYDLKTEDGLKIEVKSAAYIQSWFQRKLSQISFSIRPTLAWDYETNLQAKVKKRQADIYVFCLLHHKDKSTINPMDMSQWTFYVVSKKQLENLFPERKSITLGKLTKLRPKKCDFCGLKETINTHSTWPIK